MRCPPDPKSTAPQTHLKCVTSPKYKSEAKTTPAPSSPYHQDKKTWGLKVNAGERCRENEDGARISKVMGRRDPQKTSFAGEMKLPFKARKGSGTVLDWR